MKVGLKWQDAMRFQGFADGQEVAMDAKAPIGRGSAPTPKELVALGIGGCTAMDIIALLKKHKQIPTAFSIEVDVEPSTGVQPAVFVSAMITFDVEGPVETQTLLESVHLSQTKYCGVSAMLAKAFPIRYRVFLNGGEIGSGQAKFD